MDKGVMVHMQNGILLSFKKERVSLIAQLVKNLPAMQETQFDSWVGKELKELATHSSILAWRILGIYGAWQATVHGVTIVGQDLVTKPQPI